MGTVPLLLLRPQYWSSIRKDNVKHRKPRFPSHPLAYSLNFDLASNGKQLALYPYFPWPGHSLTKTLNIFADRDAHSKQLGMDATTAIVLAAVGGTVLLMLLICACVQNTKEQNNNVFCACACDAPASGDDYNMEAGGGGNNGGDDCCGGDDCDCDCGDCACDCGGGC